MTNENQILEITRANKIYDSYCTKGHSPLEIPFKRIKASTYSNGFHVENFIFKIVELYITKYRVEDLQL